MIIKIRIDTGIIAKTQLPVYVSLLGTSPVGICSVGFWRIVEVGLLNKILRVKVLAIQPKNMFILDNISRKCRKYL